MKEENKNGKGPEMTEDQIDFRALLFKYIIHWPWFVASVLICTGLAFAYLRYQIPVYEVSSSILIKEDDKKSTNNALSAMQDFGMLSMTSNFDNELEILKYKSNPTLTGRNIIYHFSINNDLSAVRGFQTCDHSKNSCFSASTFACNNCKCIFLNICTNVIKRQTTGISFSILFCQMFYFYHDIHLSALNIFI